jgi:hypothetical protein
MKANVFTVQTLLWLALVLALAGSLKHLAAIFASVDGNTAMGWVQAVAIDAGLFALAYSLKVRKAAKRSARPLWFGVTLFSAISIYGNLTYGLMHSGELPGWIVTIKPYILAGSLPVLVLFLSELLSDDRQHAMAATERKTEPVEINPQFTNGKTIEAPKKADSLGATNAERQAAKAGKLQQMAGILADNPEVTVTELADRLQVSRGTVRNYRRELNGQVKQ